LTYTGGASEESPPFGTGERVMLSTALILSSLPTEKLIFKQVLEQLAKRQYAFVNI
jgi:hypothetical protein